MSVRTGPPPDQAARDDIRGDLGTTFLVEAGAGSGKTRSLVERMIALLATGRAPIETLAAVTFTRKAAAELRGRFQVALEKARLDEPDPAVRDRLEAALTGLERSFIGTIHSFCARLLRERPIEAGIDPDFREMEEHEDAVLLEKCWDEYQARARLTNEAALAGLDEAGLEPAELESAFKVLAQFPDVEPVPGREDPPDQAAVRGVLDGLIDLASALVPKDKPEKGRDDLQKIFVRLFRRRRNLGFDDPRRLMESVELFDKQLEVRLERWAPSKEEDLILARKGAACEPARYAAIKARSKDTAKKMLAAAEAFQESFARPALRDWREFRHTRALAFLGPAVRFYAERRRAEGRLNFQDQLLLAARLLRDNPEVRGYFRKRFHPILVDEFQDTDPIQAEILFLLTGADDAEKDWTRLAPAPGSLFLVGDPKQSIYRFRRADIDIYNLVKDRITAGGGRILALSANFRSLDPIAAWVDPLFDPARGGAFPAGADAYQAGFMPLRTRRGRGAGGSPAGVFKATVPAVPRHTREEITEIDAARVAAFVAWALAGHLLIDGGSGAARPAEPGDVLILFRYRDRMGKYARRLEELGVPFEIAGSDAFAENAEIAEVLNLLRALDDPDDPVKAVAVLRGLFFGLSDQELVEHRAAGGGFCGLGVPGEETGTAEVRRALAMLHGWRDLVTRRPPSVALETILQQSGLLNHLVTAEMGGSRAGNVLKLVEVLRGRENEEMTSFAAAVAFMDEWVGAQAVEEISLAPGRRNAVRLMNLHKAKGLEAPIVWLANPAGCRDFEPDRHVRRTGRRPLGHFRFTKPFGQATRTVSQPVGWEASAAEEKKYEAAEEDRLMYVAATRARDLLVVSAYAGELGSRAAWPTLARGLAGLEELPPAPATTGPDRPAPVWRKRPAVKPGEVAKARETLRHKMSAASLASSLHETVTALARREAEPPSWAKGGLGLWGSEVHIMLKTLAGRWPERGPAWTAAGSADGALLRLAEDVLTASGRGPADAGELAAHVGGILRSPFWGRAMRAGRRLYEVPFTVMVGPGDAEYEALVAAAGPVPAAGGRPLVPVPGAPLSLAGAVDLLFQEADGWVIADYKTDRLPRAVEGAAAADREAALAALAGHYRAQVRLYTRFWERITGETVKESGLYFTALDRWVPIETR